MYTKEEKREFRIQFWEGFKKYSKERGRKMNSWVLKGTQIKEAQLKFDLNDNGAFVMLQIDSKSDVKRHLVYERFLKYKPVILDVCGNDLKWERDYYVKGFKHVSAIYFYFNNCSVFKKEEWGLYHKFLFDKMSLLENAFLEVKDVVQNMD